MHRSRFVLRSIMLRPSVLRHSTVAHCIPHEPVKEPTSNAPSLTYSSSSSETDVEVDDPRKYRRASTKLISQNVEDVRRILGEPGTKLIENCCGGGCCMSIREEKAVDGVTYETVELPDNEAFRALQLKIGLIPSILSGIVDLPSKTVTLKSAKSVGLENLKALRDEIKAVNPVQDQSIDFTPHHEEPAEETIDTTMCPPAFVQPHPPYSVYAAKIHCARELTRPGAEKRTYHFDLDVSNYPAESTDFKVGGAIGVMAPNEDSMVETILDLLSIPKNMRDRPIVVETASGRWPTVWGEEEARSLISTRRDLLTWCSDIQSYAPTKPLLRLLGEYATSPSEKKILEFLSSSEGQGVFCDLRTGPHITLIQLLQAFPSSKPPLDHLLSTLRQLMPRFYSLSNDPHETPCAPVDGCHRVIEIAVTVHETPSHLGGNRTGVGSGFFERQAKAFIAAEARGEKPNLRIPMFKGLMANPLAREFVSDGPMLLIGAGVGVAPFRGFVQRRLKNANCANKVWVLQGVRDSLLDELYSGEWGVHESEVKKVVQSRRGVGRYVQEEVKHQKDLVWFVINALDGRVFVCGSSKGMGEGVEKALIEVAMEMGNLGEEEAKEFWNIKKEAGQYIAETW